MSQVKLIHHVNIQITDRERTREWYERVLGACPKKLRWRER